MLKNGYLSYSPTFHDELALDASPAYDPDLKCKVDYKSLKSRQNNLIEKKVGVEGPNFRNPHHDEHELGREGYGPKGHRSGVVEPDSEEYSEEESDAGS